MIQKNDTGKITGETLAGLMAARIEDESQRAEAANKPVLVILFFVDNVPDKYQ